MKIYIAKHYWKKGENATWECHEKVDKVLFEYLKENYHKFVKSKPKSIEKNSHFVYLCYEESKDIYGRDITNVTFFISKKSGQIDYCHSAYSNLELNIPQKSKLLPIHIVLLVLGLIMVYFIFFGDKTDDINSLTDPHKKEVQHNDINVLSKKKESIVKEESVIDSKKKKRDDFNNKLRESIQIIPKKIEKYEDFNHLNKSTSSLIRKIKNPLTSDKNKREIEKLKDLVNEYGRVLKGGLEVTVKIVIPNKIRKKYELSKITFNNKECERREAKQWYCYIKQGDDVHIVLEGKGLSSLRKAKIIDKDKFIDEDILIETYNNRDDSTELIKIKNGYSIQINMRGEG